MSSKHRFVAVPAVRSAHSFRSTEPATATVLALLVLSLLPLVALAAEHPVQWPEEQRRFWMDGASLLVEEEQRNAVLEMSSEQRAEWMRDFLSAASGSAANPDTEGIEQSDLERAIDRRTSVVRQVMGAQFTMLDARARTLFLHGLPASREIVDCEHTFRPLEIWSYARPGATNPSDRDQQDHLLLYQPSSAKPFRMWIPSDGKRPLYTDEMEYWLDQFHELRAYLVGRRFDLQLCKQARDVDRITGIGGLILYERKRPTDQDMLRFTAPPSDLGAWSSEVLATEKTPEIELDPKLVSIRFPEDLGQRLLTRVVVGVEKDERLQVFEADNGERDYRLQIVALIERWFDDEDRRSLSVPDQALRDPFDAELFEETLVRYQIPVVEDDSEPSADGPKAAPEQLGLVLERGLRPGELFQMRLWVRDEVSGAVGTLTTGFEVPRAPSQEAEPSIAELILAEGDQQAGKTLAGADGIVLVPPETDVVIGLWRAEALVSGSNIEAVRFLVDGQQQFKRRGQPYSTELRLAKYPQEQIVRVEGLDADGAVVASDELVINQQRGELRVRINEPRRGNNAFGTVEAAASVVVPEERRVKKVEFLVNNETRAVVEAPPWRTTLEVPRPLTDNDLTFITVIAELDDGSRAEDVRFLGTPENLEEFNVDFVELYTSVVDRSNRPVQGLDREAFQVFEDSRKQELAKFELVDDLPITVGITIDTSGSMTRSLGEARRAAVEFLQRVVTARDRSFAVGFSDRPRLIMPRTSDVVAVSRALAGVRANGNTALYDAVVTSLYYFRGVRGRRALILLSDGEDTASSISYKDARDYAQRASVSIYTIGLNIGRLQVDVRNKLNELAGDTGGRSFYISNADELREVYGEIERELRSQYLLAYASDRPQATEGEYREIEVKMVGEGRGLKARTLSGYYP